MPEKVPLVTVAVVVAVGRTCHMVVVVVVIEMGMMICIPMGMMIHILMTLDPG